MKILNFLNKFDTWYQKKSNYVSFWQIYWRLAHITANSPIEIPCQYFPLYSMYIHNMYIHALPYMVNECWQIYCFRPSRTIMAGDLRNCMTVPLWYYSIIIMSAVVTLCTYMHTVGMYMYVCMYICHVCIYLCLCVRYVCAVHCVLFSLAFSCSWQPKDMQ